jgi:hypothetical protein
VNWDALGAISDFVGAIAVVVTLGYLAIQVRQNTSALRSTATQGAHDESAAVYDLLSGDATLADIFVRGLTSPEELTSTETARFFSVSMAYMFRYQNWYLQTRSGFIEKELLESWGRVLRQLSGTPGFQEFWRQRAHIFADEFVRYLEQGVLSSEPDPNYRPLGTSLRAR